MSANRLRLKEEISKQIETIIERTRSLDATAKKLRMDATQLKRDTRLLCEMLMAGNGPRKKDGQP